MQHLHICIECCHICSTLTSNTPVASNTMADWPARPLCSCQSHAHGREDDVEEAAVVQRDRLQTRVEALRQVEARHQTTVEGHNHTARVLHAHAQQRVLQGRNVHLTALVGLPVHNSTDRVTSSLVNCFAVRGQTGTEIISCWNRSQYQQAVRA